MKPTLLDLYRLGNMTSSRLDRYRRGVDLGVRMVDGIEWVLGNTGGVSTFAQMNPRPGIWWRLPIGTPYDDGVLLVWNDHATHWLWEPARDMPASEYSAALRRVGALFIRV